MREEMSMFIILAPLEILGILQNDSELLEEMGTHRKLTHVVTEEMAKKIRSSLRIFPNAAAMVWMSNDVRNLPVKTSTTLEWLCIPRDSSAGIPAQPPKEIRIWPDTTRISNLASLRQSSQQRP